MIYIAAVAMLLRFYNLPLKPLHHDEVLAAGKAAAARMGDLLGKIVPGI